jgi:hypothetical protein
LSRKIYKKYKKIVFLPQKRYNATKFNIIKMGSNKYE